MACLIATELLAENVSIIQAIVGVGDHCRNAHHTLDHVRWRGSVCFFMIETRDGL